MLFTRIKEWAPFHIDALGLVTILGVTEVDYAVGRLVQSYFTDCLPLLGAYTIASNQVTEPIPGFVLYNIHGRHCGNRLDRVVYPMASLYIPKLHVDHDYNL
jgi:hypothetical protein